MKKPLSYLFGMHAVQSLIEHHPERISRLWVQKERCDHKMEVIIQLAKHGHIAIETVSKRTLDQLTQEANHQGVLAFCLKDRVLAEDDLKEKLQQLSESAFVLILDGIQDPHNLGAILRSADAFGVHAVIAPKDQAVGITATVSKVASGAAESIDFYQVTNLVRTIEMLKTCGIWIYGADMEAKQNLYQAQLSGPCAIALGAEGKGLRRLTKEHCDQLIHIPMRGEVASLNVSVATGIFLFEVARQRFYINP